ncbi:Zinc finger CCCH domain-containing protein 25 [Colletotrichum trifolii]|uniref:Zinc finger CCCH domain-containing protein 25 n=1 Tax=Colletotrichum trifolii TaxID=5466 RepID=A0A4R8RYA7_COLTR|nr:Zinc finger CCCH domain-containing protein 25 [Colletotrichum trifolii]
MNQIRAIQALNQKEIENGITPEGSWHVDYRDTAYIYFGGLPYELSEGDVITVFSQFGEPVWLKLARDKETGKSKGFGWLKYEDQRSTDLAVDNLGGATIGNRLVRVDHARYKFRDDEDQDEGKVDWATVSKLEGDGDKTDEESEEEEERPMLPEERELALLIQNHDDDDPMKGFLIEEKKKEIREALARRGDRSDKRRKHKHRHRSHRSRRHDSDEEMKDADRDDDKSRSRRR